MHRHAVSLVAVGALMVVVSGGCSLSKMEKEVKEATARSRVELNSAHRKRLAELPGLTGADADKIIANRPYGNRRDLVRKGVLSEAQFQKIRDSVYVEHGKD